MNNESDNLIVVISPDLNYNSKFKNTIDFPDLTRYISYDVTMTAPNNFIFNYLCNKSTELISIISHKTGIVNLRLQPPASKSISNRLLLMSALSENKMIIENLSDSDDTRVIINALASEEKEKDIGHAGTAMRFLTAYYALMPGEVILTGSERMKNRPVGELTEILCKLGANIEYIERDGYPPIKIKGGNLKSRDIEINSSISSQYISALLMIAPMLEKGLKIKLKGKTTSASYINLTIELMKKAGIQCNWKCDEILVSPGKYLAGKFYVEPDWSGASYWYAIASLAKEAEILLEGLEQNSLQGDFAVKSIFEKLGVKTTFTAGGALLKNTGKRTKHFNFIFYT